MPLLPLRKIKIGPGQRPPQSTVGAIGTWIGKELWELLRRAQTTVDWAVDYLGLASVDATDEPGVLEDKLEGSATVTITKTGTDGDRKLTFSASGWGSSPSPWTYPTYPDSPTGTPGTATTQFSMGDHRHPFASPDFEVDCMYTGPVSCAPSTWGGWTYSASAKTWTRNTASPVVASACDDLEPFEGMHVLAWDPGLTISADKKGAGVYELTNLGGDSGTDYAVLTRIAGMDASSEFVKGMTVRLTGGAIHANQLWYLATDTPLVMDTTEQLWLLVAGEEQDHTKLTKASKDTRDEHPPTAAGHWTGVLDDDWSSDGTVQAVPGLSRSVYAGESYRVYAELLVLVDSSEGYTVTIGGGPDAGSVGFIDGNCALLHSCKDWASVATGWGSSTNQFRELRWQGGLDDSGLVTCHMDTVTYAVVHRISGIVHVTADGSLAVRMDSEPIDYHTSVLLMDSFFEITRIA